MYVLTKNICYIGKALPHLIKRSSEQNLNKKKPAEMKIVSVILRKLSEQDMNNKKEKQKVVLNIFKKSVQAAMQTNYGQYKQLRTDQVRGHPQIMSHVKGGGGGQQK